MVSFGDGDTRRIMDTPVAPPYGDLFERARKGRRITVQHAAASAGIVKQTWIDVVKGRTASPKADTLAGMARAVGVSADRLEDEGKRPDAAEVLREMLLVPPPPGPLPLRPATAAGTAPDKVEEILADLTTRYEGEAGDVVRVMAAQRGKGPGGRLTDVLRFLKDPELDREVIARLTAAYPGDEVTQALGRQRLKKPLMVAEEILGRLDWRPPEMEAGNGTAG